MRKQKTFTHINPLLLSKLKQQSHEPISTLLLTTSRSQRPAKTSTKLARERFNFEKTVDFCKHEFPMIPTENYLTVDSDIFNESNAFSCTSQPNAVNRWKSVDPLKERRKRLFLKTGSGFLSPRQPLSPRTESTNSENYKTRFIKSPRLLTGSVISSPKAQSVKNVLSQGKCEKYQKKSDNEIKNALKKVGSRIKQRRTFDEANSLLKGDQFLQLFNSECLDKPRLDAIKIIVDKLQRDNFVVDEEKHIAVAIKPVKTLSPSAKAAKLIADFEADVKSRIDKQNPARLIDGKNIRVSSIDRIKKYVPQSILKEINTGEQKFIRTNISRTRLKVMYENIENGMQNVIDIQTEGKILQDTKQPYKNSMARDFFYVVKQGDLEQVKQFLKFNPELINENDHVFYD